MLALRPAPRSAAGTLRARRRDLALGVVRVGCALVSVLQMLGKPALRDVLVANAVFLVVAAVALAVRPRGADDGARSSRLLTLGTLLFWVGCTVAWHDLRGAGSALGVLALVEAPLRYGVRGAALSGTVVTTTALLLPQLDGTGDAPGATYTLALVALLLAPSVWLRAGTEQEVARAERVDAAVAEALAALPVGVAVVDAEGTLVHGNPRLGALLGDPADPLGRLRAVARDSGADRQVALLLSGGGSGDVELRAGQLWLSVGASPTGQGRVVVHVEDVTATRSERVRLQALASVDALTGLHTRASGEAALARRSPEGRLLAVLFVDLDGVKRLNDREGHAAGDAVLAEVGARLRRLLREEDLAVRWGGDEFVLVARVDAPEEADAVAERVRVAVREPVPLPDGRWGTVTASVGLVLSPEGPAGLVAQADDAMYAAKRDGGDRVVTALSLVRGLAAS
ncbi:MAG: diguanylate cyclase [Frankiales bacterium]|nr:diguanylate cyclase [Frankiales bacterium]